MEYRIKKIQMKETTSYIKRESRLAEIGYGVIVIHFGIDNPDAPLAVGEPTEASALKIRSLAWWWQCQ